MEQALIKQRLQQKIFSHPTTKQFNAYSQSVLIKLSKCHTIKLGVHVYRCNECHHQHYQYHSCGPDSYREALPHPDSYREWWTETGTMAARQDE